MPGKRTAVSEARWPVPGAPPVVLYVYDPVGDQYLPVTGVASSDGKSAALQSDATGTWDYRAGASGSPSAFTGKVIGITAHATTAGSMTINGGDTVPIPANASVVWTPLGDLVSPALVFAGTDSFIVEFLY